MLARMINLGREHPTVVDSGAPQLTGEPYRRHDERENCQQVCRLPGSMRKGKKTSPDNGGKEQDDPR